MKFLMIIRISPVKYFELSVFNLNRFNKSARGGDFEIGDAILVFKFTKTVKFFFYTYSQVLFLSV